MDEPQDGQDLNPYAAPQFSGPPLEVHDQRDPEQIRREHLEHETTLRSWGGLFACVGLCGTMAAAIYFFGLAAEAVSDWRAGKGVATREATKLAVAALCIPAGTVLLTTGWGLWHLKPKVRLPALFVAAICLLAVPCGTPVGAHLLYLLLSRKGQMVLSCRYAEIRQQTPHVHYQAPAWNLIVAVVVIVALVILLGLSLR